MADKKLAVPRGEDDLLVGARMHVRAALAKRLVAGASTPPSAPIPAPSTPAERMLDDFLVGRGLHVTRSVIWPEATRVAGAGGAAAVGGVPGADAPLEAAAGLYSAHTNSRDSCVQTDAGALGMDPMSALGESGAALPCPAWFERGPDWRLVRRARGQGRDARPACMPWLHCARCHAGPAPLPGGGRHRRLAGPFLAACAIVPRCQPAPTEGAPPARAAPTAPHWRFALAAVLPPPVPSAASHAPPPPFPSLRTLPHT